MIVVLPAGQRPFKVETVISGATCRRLQCRYNNWKTTGALCNTVFRSDEYRFRSDMSRHFAEWDTQAGPLEDVILNLDGWTQGLEGGRVDCDKY